MRREVWCSLVWSPQSHRTVGSLWRESGLNWTDFLPEGEDVQAFISQQVGAKCLHSNQEISVLRENVQSPFITCVKTYLIYSNTFSFLLFSHCIIVLLPRHKQKLQFVLSDGSRPEASQSKRILSPEELSRQLERLLLEDMATDEQIFDWVEVWQTTGDEPLTNWPIAKVYALLKFIHVFCWIWSFNIDGLRFVNVQVSWPRQ